MASGTVDAAAPTAAATAASPGGQSSPWIVSPWFDLLFFINIGWLLAWLPGFVATDGSTRIDFWQVYFLTTPHRWMTLVLVASDPERRAGRNRLFVMIAVGVAVLVLGARLTTGEFLCLALIDQVWNGWHFASQHSGILRIYSRKAGAGHRGLETYGLRGFVFYVAIRLIGWVTGWTDDYPAVRSALAWIDYAVLAAPALMLAVELRRFTWQRIGKLAYLASVSAIYTGLLLAVSGGHRTMVLALVAASAMFHAVEYLAIVTHYAWRRKSHGAASPFQLMARHWLLVLAAFMVCFGLVDGFAHRTDFADHWVLQAWIGLNLWAAFLHYTYDGMIWKLRKPATADALGIARASGGEAGKGR